MKGCCVWSFARLGTTRKSMLVCSSTGRLNLKRHCGSIAAAGSTSRIAGPHQHVVLGRRRGEPPAHVRFARTAATTTSAKAETAMVSVVPAAPTSTGSSNGGSGAKAFQAYLGVMHEIQQRQVDNERIKSEQLYASWKKAADVDESSEALTKNRNAGVAIVRTIAKQHQDQSTTSDKAASKLDDEAQLKAKAKSFLVAAADTFRYPPAQVQLANDMLLESLSSQTPDTRSTLDANMETALSYYRQAGEQGLAEGWYNLGHFLWTGMDGVRSADTEQAERCFRRAIALGDCDAMFFLGVHVLGRGMDNETADATDETVVAALRNPESTDNAAAGSTTIHQTNDVRHQLQQALQWIEDAASKDHGGALHYLATFYLNGYPPLQIPPCDQVDFLRRLEAAIQHDETGDAHFLRGSCYYSGTSWHDHNVRMALDDFLVAADLGHADAAVNAGAILHQGNAAFRIQPDHQRAFHLYQLAGELGSIEGWRNVVACYATGEGVKQSMETAKYIAETMLRGV